MRKLPFDRSPGVHVRPHVLAAPPRVRDLIDVDSVDVASGAVHEAPPSHDSSTHMRGEPAVSSTRVSRRTSMPLTVAPDGREMTYVKHRCLSRAELVHDQ